MNPPTDNSETLIANVDGLLETKRLLVKDGPLRSWERIRDAHKAHLHRKGMPDDWQADHLASEFGDAFAMAMNFPPF